MIHPNIIWLAGIPAATIILAVVLTLFDPDDDELLIRAVLGAFIWPLVLLLGLLGAVAWWARRTVLWLTRESDEHASTVLPVAECGCGYCEVLRKGDHST